MNVAARPQTQKAVQRHRPGRSTRPSAVTAARVAAPGHWRCCDLRLAGASSFSQQIPLCSRSNDSMIHYDMRPLALRNGEGDSVKMPVVNAHQPMWQSSLRHDNVQVSIHFLDLTSPWRSGSEIRCWPPVLSEPALRSSGFWVCLRGFAAPASAALLDTRCRATAPRAARAKTPFALLPPPAATSWQP